MSMEKIISQNKEWIDSTWEKVDKKLKLVRERSYDKIPYTTHDGVHDNKLEEEHSTPETVDRGPAWWTNGFWPGMMWLMYADTKDEGYLRVGRHAEELLDGAFKQYDGLHHDVGFMWKLAAGADYQLTNDENARLRTIYAANMLAGRFNPMGNFIRSWNTDKNGWVIIDSMLNIPILYWASREFNDDRFKAMAMIHADTVMRTHIRSDGSVRHIVSLDPTNGEYIEDFGGQGYEKDSSWSRGQTWAMYGFILSYIHTGKQEYLDTAKNVSHYFIANVCDDWMPKVDFRSPKEPVYFDSTASACAACALIEIANAVPEFEKPLYLNAAINLLKAIEANWCNWSDDEDSIVQMGTEAYYPGSGRNGRNIPIIYGDFYFIEALYKLRGNEILFW